LHLLSCHRFLRVNWLIPNLLVHRFFQEIEAFVTSIFIRKLLNIKVKISYKSAILKVFNVFFAYLGPCFCNKWRITLVKSLLVQCKFDSMSVEHSATCIMLFDVPQGQINQAFVLLRNKYPMRRQKECCILEFALSCDIFEGNSFRLIIDFFSGILVYEVSICCDLCKLLKHFFINN